MRAACGDVYAHGMDEARGGGGEVGATDGAGRKRPQRRRRARRRVARDVRRVERRRRRLGGEGVSRRPRRARRDRGIRGVGTTGTGTRTRTRIGMSSRGWGRWGPAGWASGWGRCVAAGSGTRLDAPASARPRTTPANTHDTGTVAGSRSAWPRRPRARVVRTSRGEGRGREASGAREEGSTGGSSPRAISATAAATTGASISRRDETRVGARSVLEECPGTRGLQHARFSTHTRERMPVREDADVKGRGGR